MLRLAVPSILANITIPLVGIVDVAIIGHISSAAAVGGIAVGTMLFDLLYWNFAFLRVGTSGMTAQAYGRGDVQEQSALLRQSLTIAFGGAVLIWLLQWFFVTLVLWLMPCSAEVADFAKRYFFVRVWAAPATLALYALKGWFIGMQNTVAPMITDIVVNVVNMVASYVLAVYTPLGAIGVAWGTLIAQYTGLLTAGVILLARYREHIREGFYSLCNWKSTPSPLRASQSSATIEAHWASNVPVSGGELSGTRRFFRLNTNLFLRSLAFMVIYVGYTVMMSAYGDAELAVSAILMKIFMFFSYFIDGFAYAAEALVGKEGVSASNTLWNKNARVQACVRVLYAWGAGLGIAFTLLFGVFASDWIALMTSDADLQLTAQPYYIYLWLMPALSSFAFVYDGVFIGATMAVPVRNCMFYSAAAFVLTYIAAAPLMGAAAVYLAYMMHLVARTVYLAVKWAKL
ncbi:MAG: MATE family efflux transporter [Paludibacteraceae bacterium]|nr:MATE family efflux transporter [Paludibacteraceae bacterium]